MSDKMHALPQQGSKMDSAPSAPQLTPRFEVQLPAEPEPSFGVWFRWWSHLALNLGFSLGSNLVHEVCELDCGQSSSRAIIIRTQSEWYETSHEKLSRQCYASWYSNVIYTETIANSWGFRKTAMWHIHEFQTQEWDTELGSGHAQGWRRKYSSTAHTVGSQATLCIIGSYASLECHIVWHM